ncbi:hypothetical protein CROQUDRAFT_100497 [Cronartium quercuum f. sp. fusiforme G11]|uniref:Transmembrane protein n=1 Tax=Cronartium quercuum f. sp. fusiforme G11 TaxID=708437 RepID=A0A9P6T5R3_9BASI|nr:hypothetical protein CROQUDRAFT_100497 [Cronartium quercuum f. sp. fusiforme G11]
MACHFGNSVLDTFFCSPARAGLFVSLAATVSAFSLLICRQTCETQSYDASVTLHGSLWIIASTTISTLLVDRPHRETMCALFRNQITKIPSRSVNETHLVWASEIAVQLSFGSFSSSMTDSTGTTQVVREEVTKGVFNGNRNHDHLTPCNCSTTPRAKWCRKTCCDKPSHWLSQVWWSLSIFLTVACDTAFGVVNFCFQASTKRDTNAVRTCTGSFGPRFQVREQGVTITTRTTGENCDALSDASQGRLA